MEVVVEYEYDALQDDELTLRLGDIIKNVRRIEEDGWMEGDLNGKRGLFPDNFVKEVKKESKEVKETKVEEKKEETSLPQKREKSAGNVANLVQRMSTIGIPTGGFQPQPPATPKKPKKRQCKALFDYQPQNEDELELKIGDILEITEEVEEGWWSGTMNGKSGLFPSNFVKELEATGEDGDSTQPHNNATEEIDGSTVDSATTPQATSGNGVTAQPKKVRGVGFGDIFREGSVKLRVRRTSTDTEDKKEKPTPSLPSAAKPNLSNMTDLQKVDGDNKSKVKEYCKVTFAFDASNEDELSLKEGEIIHVLSKDTGEPGWWRGEINGKEGVFPDNFVVMISEGEKETLVSRGSLKSSPKQDAEETPMSRGSLKSSSKQDVEEKPIKPPPPLKRIENKELPSADKKPYPIKPENRVDKPSPDHRKSPPQVPIKKKILPPAKVKQVPNNPPRPDKPLAPTPNLKHNGEMPSVRPKSELGPSLPSKIKTLSGDWGEKPLETMDLMSFDDLSSSSEKLNHPTANRPKMPGRRLPAHFIGGHSPNKELIVEKSLKVDEEDAKDAKLKQTDTRKRSTSSPSPPLQKSVTASAECRPSTSASLSLDGISQSNKAQLETEEPSSQLDELRNQMKELLLSVDLLKSQQMKEITELRVELDEERQKRMALQMEIEKLKRAVHLT